MKTALARSLVLLGVVTAFPDRAVALSLSADAQLGVSKAAGPGERWTVWARRSDGVLVSRHDNPSAGFVWATHTGVGIGAVPTQGVSATGWTGATGLEEHAYYVSLNRVHERILIPGDPNYPAWLQYTPPAGRTLSGYIAATTTLIGGARTARVFATMTNGDFMCLNTATQIWDLLLTGVDTSSPIAASSSPDGTRGRGFVRKLNSIYMARVTSAGWVTQQFPAAPGGYTMGGTMAVAEATIGTSYFIYLFCTRTNPTHDQLYIAVGEGVDDLGFNWVQRGTPNAEQIRNTPFALAATRRTDGSSYSIDAYLTTTTGAKLYFVKHTPTSGVITQISAGDLGSDGESTLRRGGMAAMPSGLVNPAGIGYSYGCYIGQAVNASRLYRRVGDNSIHFPASSHDSWRNHQSGDPWHTVVPVAEANHAESSTAVLRGRAVTVSIRRPGLGGMARVESQWSNDDGDTWGPSVLLPDNGLPYTSDPVVDFDDDGTAWAVMIGLDFINGDCSEGEGAAIDKTIFVVSSATGDAWSVPQVLSPVNSSPDHPWIGIYRNPANPTAADDRYHVVWNTGTDVKHVTKVGNGAWSAVHSLGFSGIPGISTLTVGQGGATYVVSAGGQICRLNPAFDGCEAIQPVLTGACGFTVQNLLPIPGVPPGEPAVMQAAQPWSIHASPTNGNRLYYAFAQRETDLDATELDVRATVITYNAIGNPPFTCATPTIPVTDKVNDDRDQFSPALSVVGRGPGGSDFLSVSWYDRRNPEGDCEGEVNRCYRMMRSVSLDSGFTFVNTQEVPMDSIAGSIPTDPALLPRHCLEPTIRFVGEYHETRGDRLHTMQVGVGVPAGSAETEDGASGLFGAWVAPGFYNWNVP